MADIIIGGDKELDRPKFTSEGLYKHAHQPWICWFVRLPQDTFNPDQYLGECIIDGKRMNVVAVIRPTHVAPWRRDELISLAVKI